MDNQRSIERDSGSYLVEFPYDEDAEIGNNNYTLQEEDEQKLALAMTTTLVLKRTRDSAFSATNEEDVQGDWYNTKKYKKDRQLLLMAEEAGLSTPLPLNDYC